MNNAIMVQFISSTIGKMSSFSRLAGACFFLAFLWVSGCSPLDGSGASGSDCAFEDAPSMEQAQTYVYDFIQGQLESDAKTIFGDTEIISVALIQIDEIHFLRLETENVESGKIFEFKVGDIEKIVSVYVFNNCNYQIQWRDN